ncbi:Megakaryocyte-associated tyrosine-protein kinase [Taenia solium]|eukprot:TsM_000186000 transcript=TsM_000186000 gene=TsM_000186000
MVKHGVLRLSNPPPPHKTVAERRRILEEPEWMVILCPGRPMVMENAAEGNMVDYLRCNRSCLAIRPLAMTRLILLRFVLQVVNGMAFLASKGAGIVHSDLAARNVMMTSDLVAKVADFSLTRKSRVPLKWMAPESVFHKVFPTKSDVVLLRELFSLGDPPAAAVLINEFLQVLHKGAPILTKPKKCLRKGLHGDNAVLLGSPIHIYRSRRHTIKALIGDHVCNFSKQTRDRGNPKVVAEVKPAELQVEKENNSFIEHQYMYLLIRQTEEELE